ncbi:ribonuclease H-like domain-containing protein [Chytridium lagenaria]|nr:ribonuclease H-like domain-containing protein [Chytridium lagenaria]
MSLIPENVEEVSKDILEALSSTTTSTAFLGTRDLPFFKSSSPELAALLNDAEADEAIWDLHDVVDRYAEVVDFVDTLLEKADICMDEVSGKNKKNGQGNTPAQTAAVVVKFKSQAGSKPGDYQVVHAQNITRPQLLFEDKVDNSNSPFIRKLRFKDNAMRPLDDGMPSSGQLTQEMIDNIPYPADMFKVRPEIMYSPLEEKPFNWIATVEDLQGLMMALETAKEIAVDIEVFHGADMDVIWLQRDFGIYIVNLFDTYHASHALELSSHGLAPSPKEMLKYARMDTHYLLYIYDRMRNEVLLKSDPETQQLLHVVLRRSEQTSLKLYEKSFTMRRTARARTDGDEDESVRYVLPTHMLMNLATEMPRDVAGVLSCCNPVPNLNKEVLRQHPELAAPEKRGRCEMVFWILFLPTTLPATLAPNAKTGRQKPRQAVLKMKEVETSYGSLERRQDEGYASAVDSVDLAHAEKIRKIELIKKRKREEEEKAVAAEEAAKQVVPEKVVVKSAIAEINPKKKKDEAYETDMVLDDVEPRFKYPDAKALMEEFEPKKKGSEEFNPQWGDGRVWDT